MGTVIVFDARRLLNITIEEKRLDMARVILKSGKVPQDDIQFCLIYRAIPLLDKEAFDLLTEFGGDVNDTGYYNIGDNAYQYIKFAIDNGLDTNLRPNKISLLQSAIEMDLITVTQLLLDHPNTDIYKCGNEFEDNEPFRIVTKERNYRSIQATYKLLPIDLRRLLFEMINGERADNKRMRSV